MRTVGSPKFLIPNIIFGLNDPPIYGVSWDGGESPTLTRTNSATGMVANAGVDSQVVQNDFDHAQIFGEFEEYTDSYGNVFENIPKFYIKKTAVSAARTWQVSKKRMDGAYLPSCFWDFTNKRELPYYSHAKFNASLSSDGTKLESKPNKFPLVNKNIVDFRGYAAANGTGYQQLDAVEVDVLQTLFTIEFATLNSQSIMYGWAGGRYTATDLAVLTETNVNRIALPNSTAALYAVGQPIAIGTTQGGNQICYGRNITSIGTNDDAGTGNRYITFDGDPVNITAGNYLYNVGWKSGFSSDIAAKSGSIGSNSTGKFPCVYRGIENPWGSVWQFVDGINIIDNQAWVSNNPADYASNLFASPYKQLSYSNANTDGYISQMGYDSDNPFVQLPIGVAGAYNKYYSDYCYQATGKRIARLGGYFGNGAYAGLSCWALSSASGAAYVDGGGRLVRKAL